MLKKRNDRKNVESIKKNSLDLFKISTGRLLLISFLVWLPFIIIIGVVIDAKYGFASGQYFFRGDLPYRDIYKPYYSENSAEIRIRGPLSYFIMAFIVLITGNNFMAYFVGVRVVFVLTNLGLVIFMEKLFRRYLNEDLTRIGILYYLINPIIYIYIALGTDEIIPLLFSFIAIYYLDMKRYKKSAFFMGLSIGYNFMAIFFYIIIIPYFLSKNGFKDLLQHIGVIILTFLMLSLPYLILIPQDYIHGLLKIFQKEISISFIIGPIAAIENPIYTLNIWSLTINITILLIIRITLYLITIFYFIVKKIPSRLLMEHLAIAMILIAILTFSTHLRTLLYLFPFLIFITLRKYQREAIPSDTDKKNRNIADYIAKSQKTKFFFNFNYKFWAIIGVIYVIIFYSTLVDSYLEMDKYESLVFLMVEFVIFFTVWVIINLKLDFYADLTRKLNLYAYFYSMSMPLYTFGQFLDHPTIFFILSFLTGYISLFYLYKFIKNAIHKY